MREPSALRIQEKMHQRKFKSQSLRVAEKHRLIVSEEQLSLPPKARASAECELIIRGSKKGLYQNRGHPPQNVVNCVVVQEVPLAALLHVQASQGNLQSLTKIMKAASRACCRFLCLMCQHLNVHI